MGSLSKSPALAPGWQAPFALGCAAGGLCAALLGAAWAAHRRREEGLREDPHHLQLPALTSSVQPRSGKRKARKHLPRGDGAPGGAGDAGAAARDPAAADGLGDDPAAPDREVLHEDAIAWLEDLPARGGLPAGCCVLTGVPDVHEVDPEGRMGMDGWEQWYQRAVELVLQRLPKGSLAIFMQTDIKQLAQEDGTRQDGSGKASGNGQGQYWRWVDKAHLAMLAADRVPGARLLWHKVIFSGVLSAGGRNSGVAGYSHFLCFTTGEDPEPLDSFPCPDVLRKGLATWVAGSGVQALEEVCTYLRARGVSCVVDPFCGEGSVLAVANALGMRALGVEITKKRVKIARRQDGVRLLAADRAERARLSSGRG